MVIGSAHRDDELSASGTSVFGISSITIIFDFTFTPVFGVSADWLLDPPKRPPIIGGVALYSDLCSLHCTILTNFNLYVS